MNMPSRSYSIGGKYRYGFNGKELDKDIDGNSYDYGFRIYNPGLGRFLSVDPLTKGYPWYTPYQFSGNKPINSIDVDGLEDHNVVTNEVDNTLTSSGSDHKPANDPVAHGNSVKPWIDLLKFVPPNALWDATKNRIGTQIIPFTTTNIIQYIGNGNSTNTNLDYYAVKITSLPKSIKDGAALFDFIRLNLGLYLDDHTTFKGYNKKEKERWDSKNPLGSVVSFDAFFDPPIAAVTVFPWLDYFTPYNLDDASVMTSSYFKGNNGGYWTFTTLSTRGDGEHPIAGTRQFGLTDNKDGSYTFYTRGVDRAYGLATKVAGSDKIFKSAELTWSTLMNNIFTDINNSPGGSALIPSTPISKRLNWEKVVSPEIKK